jgi:anti-sigma B factor antagonist
MSPSPHLRLLTRKDIGSLTVVRFKGHDVRLHEENIRSVSKELCLLIEDFGRRRLALDFGNVTYLTSTTLGQLVGLHTRLHALSGGLVLYNVRPQIHEVFSLTRLDTVLEIRDGEEVPENAGTG